MTNEERDFLRTKSDRKNHLSDTLRRVTQFFDRNHTRRWYQLSIITLLTIVILPLTVLLARQNQDTRQHAEQSDISDKNSGSQNTADNQNSEKANGNTKDVSGNNGGNDFNRRLDEQSTGSSPNNPPAEQTTNGTSGNAAGIVDQSNPGQGKAFDQFGLSQEQAQADVDAAKRFLKDAAPGSEQAVTGEKNLGIAIDNLQRAESGYNPSSSGTASQADIDKAVNDILSGITIAKTPDVSVHVPSDAVISQESPNKIVINTRLSH